jgi:hypothetical protein
MEHLLSIHVARVGLYKAFVGCGSFLAHNRDAEHLPGVFTKVLSYDQDTQSPAHCIFTTFVIEYSSNSNIIVIIITSANCMKRTFYSGTKPWLPCPPIRH